MPTIIRQLREEIDLVVVSQVMFMNGQIIHDLEQLAEACHSIGAKLLVDCYHAVGVFPVDISGMRADFAIGADYLRLMPPPQLIGLHSHLSLSFSENCGMNDTVET